MRDPEQARELIAKLTGWYEANVQMGDLEHGVCHKALDDDDMLEVLETPLDSLMDVKGELHTIGVDWFKRFNSPDSMLRVILKIAVISSSLDDWYTASEDYWINRAASVRRDYLSLAWTYACGIGVGEDEEKALACFQASRGICGQVYRGLFSPMSIPLHSYIMGRVDSTRYSEQALSDLLDGCEDADGFRRLAFSEGVLMYLYKHSCVEAFTYAVDRITGGCFTDHLRFGLLELMRPTVAMLGDSELLGEDEIQSLLPLEGFVRKTSADYLWSNVSCTYYLGEEGAIFAKRLFSLTRDDVISGRLESAMEYSPENVVRSWLHQGTRLFDDLEPCYHIIDPDDVDHIPWLRTLVNESLERKRMEFLNDIREARARLPDSVKTDRLYELDELEQELSKSMSFDELTSYQAHHSAVVSGRYYVSEYPEVSNIFDDYYWSNRRAEFDRSSDMALDERWDNANVAGSEKFDTDETDDIQMALDGNPGARFRCAMRLLDTEGVTSDMLLLLRSSAIAGYVDAQFNLAVMNLEGMFDGADGTEGVRWLYAAALSGDLEACSLIGYYTREDESVEDVAGISRSDVESVTWNRIGAMYGDPDAQFNLAVQYEFGLGVGCSKTRALYWYGRASRHVPEALFNMAIMHQTGEGIPRSTEDAEDLYRKAVDGGCLEAMTNLGSMIWAGDAKTHDIDEARDLFERAAEAGEVVAIHNLGYMYDTGDGVGMSKRKAVELYSRAAELGYIPSVVNLAVMYENGEGVRKDPKMAASLYGQAADAGETDCMTHLADMYLDGRGVRRSRDTALELYRRAADAGDTDAMFNLGVLYVQEESEPGSRDRAAELWSRASEMGHPMATYYLAVLRGEDGSDEEAAELYARAADLGVEDAMMEYARILESRGETDGARELYARAADLGNRRAVKALKRMGVSWKARDSKGVHDDDVGKHAHVGPVMARSPSIGIMRPRMDLRFAGGASL